MKKILFVLLFMAFVFLPSFVFAEEGEVTIYLFRGSTCEHCEAALSYINDHKDELPEGVSFVTYEVWENKNNAKLQEAVAGKVGVEEKYKTSVPLFVVGEKHMVGYSSAVDFQEIIGYAKEYLEEGNYTDMVKESIKELNLDVKSMSLEQLFSEPNKVVTIVVYSIFGVIVLGIGAMILFSRKK